MASRRMPSLPAGFRFHPTDEELIVHYLMNQAASTQCPVPIIAEVNIYRCNPWDLPREFFFNFLTACPLFFTKLSIDCEHCPF
jgi:hypothetical protein